MENVKLRYKSDKYGNAMVARVVWKHDVSTTSPRPIVLILHAGGLIVGSSDIVPKPQLDYLCSSEKGVVVVIPNYRLAPQVTGKEAYQDCIDAYDWATTELVRTMQDQHGVTVDSKNVLAMGHSIGGTLALHVASLRPVKAVTAFYPSLSLSDTSSSGHKPTSAPPFGLAPDFTPTEAEQALITPEGIQLSEAKLALPGSVPAPRNKWQMHMIKKGQWPSTTCPDGDYAALDPLTRVSAHWPPIMIVQGELDNVPASSPELAEKAVSDMKAAGVTNVQLVKVPGEAHMFDLPPMVGTSDLGPKWEAVLQGLGHLIQHA